MPTTIQPVVTGGYVRLSSAPLMDCAPYSTAVRGHLYAVVLAVLGLWGLV